jgi:hypothetical protein
MSFTFKVDEVTKEVRSTVRPWSAVVGAQFSREASRWGEKSAAFGAQVDGASDVQLIEHTTSSALVRTVGVAYNEHRGLSLSPDHLWLAIAHGFAKHVKMNAEELRKQFVSFEGKQYLEVQVDDFVKNSPDNDWTRLFGQFSEQIEKHIGKKKDLLVCDFTTTGVVERAASEVVLMDAMSRYFDYGMRTCCGFPEITLEGTVEDWQSVLTRVGNLREFGNIGWWIDPLEMICTKIVETAQGKPDIAFWRSLYIRGGGSGGPYISGWINVFYPFLGEGKYLCRNQFLEEESFHPMMASIAKAALQDGGKFNRNRLVGMGDGPTLCDFQSQLSVVPVKWHYLGAEFEMRFVAGLGGATTDENGTVRPAAVWSVLDVTELTGEQRSSLGLSSGETDD